MCVHIPTHKHAYVHSLVLTLPKHLEAQHIPKNGKHDTCLENIFRARTLALYLEKECVKDKTFGDMHAQTCHVPNPIE